MNIFASALILSVGLGLLTACVTPAPPVNEAEQAAAAAPCTGIEPSCKQMNVRFEVVPNPAKLSKNDRKKYSDSIYGHCEIVVDTGHGATQTYPCRDLRLSLKKNTGEERLTWLQGFDYQITDLSHGYYSMIVYSDQFGTGTEKEKIQPGHSVNIQLRLTARADSK